MKLIRVTVEKEVKYTRTVTVEIGEGKNADDAKDAAVDYVKRVGTGWEQTDVCYLPLSAGNAETGVMVDAVA